MATFAKSTFSASSYAAFRPSYPPKVLSILLNFHTGGHDRFLDLGCGHGELPRSFAPHFKSVTGIDPSVPMIAQARSSSPTDKFPNLTFRQGSAEDLSFIPDGSIDMVIAAQAAHWFDYGKVWPQLRDKVKKGGTLAFVGYKDNSFVDYPAATKILDHYCYGPEKMGPFWQQPGRNILRDKLRDVKPPPEDWEDIRRIEYEPGVKGKNSGVGEVIWGKKLKLGEVEGYLRTFSAYINWMGEHPEEKPKKEGGDGDVVDEMFEKMIDEVPDWKTQATNWRDIEVENEWGSVILLAKRK